MTNDNNEKKTNKNNFISFFKKTILNLKTFNKLLFILIIALGIFYLAGTNDLAIKGYTLSDLKGQRNKLADENNKLEIKIMSLSSYNIITGKIDNLKMVAVGDIDYINGGNNIVAKK